MYAEFGKPLSSLLYTYIVKRNYEEVRVTMTRPSLFVWGKLGAVIAVTKENDCESLRLDWLQSPMTKYFSLNPV